MNDQQRTERLGRVSLLPTTPVPAGQMGTWTLTYTTGSYGIDSGGQIKVAFPLVTDWETVQFDHPSRSGFTSVVTDGAAKLHCSWQPKGYVRPWNRCLVVDVYDGSLDPGDTITIILGDTSNGSPGMRAQTYIESHYEFRVLVDPTNGCNPRPLPTSPKIAVVASDICKLVCLIPSQGMVDKEVEIFLKGEDEWRNPVAVPGAANFRWIGAGAASFATDKMAVNKMTVDSTGIGVVEATIGHLVARSNPIELRACGNKPGRYWGDLHGQTKETVGTGSEDEYFAFGRDWSNLDFMSHQGNDFQISDVYWQHINETAAAFQDDERFVVFPGYEWSANSPAGGDHNVIYRHEGMPILRSSHWLVPDIDESELSPAHPADVFFAKLKEAVAPEDVLVCAHVGGRYANIRRYFDQELVSLVEVVSCWGVFEWMLWDAFDKGYIVGVMCNSDGHHGRPGAEGSGLTEFGIENGLTCVLAHELTRSAIFDALKARRCYGTTGARMLLEFQADSQPMGSVIKGIDTDVHLTASATGTAPLESLQLFQGRDILSEVRPDSFSDVGGSNRIRVRWQGSRERGRQRRVTWDGTLHVTGTSILYAQPYSFDVVADGILSQTEHEVTFRSRTTGDADGIDLYLSDVNQGQLTFNSSAGVTNLDLSELTSFEPRNIVDFGGVDMRVMIERYPAEIETSSLELMQHVTPPAGQLTPYFVKATQVDGQMAWSSPIYLETGDFSDLDRTDASAGR